MLFKAGISSKLNFFLFRESSGIWALRIYLFLDWTVKQDQFPLQWESWYKQKPACEPIIYTNVFIFDSIYFARKSLPKITIVQNKKYLQTYQTFLICSSQEGKGNLKLPVQWKAKKINKYTYQVQFFLSQTDIWIHHPLTLNVLNCYGDYGPRIFKWLDYLLSTAFGKKGGHNSKAEGFHFFSSLAHQKYSLPFIWE